MMRNEIDLDRIDTAMEPPEYEPMRQYYYMAKCRELLREAELRTGRKQTAYNLCLGCQMNAEIENVQKKNGNPQKYWGFRSFLHEINSHREASFLLL